MRVRKATMITGSASGLGKEFAKIYAERGDDLILVDCDFDKLKAVKKEIGILYGDVEVIVLEADLSRYEDLKRIRYFAKRKAFLSAASSTAPDSAIRTISGRWRWTGRSR